MVSFEQLVHLVVPYYQVHLLEELLAEGSLGCPQYTPLLRIPSRKLTLNCSYTILLHLVHFLRTTINPGALYYCTYHIILLGLPRWRYW